MAGPQKLSFGQGIPSPVLAQGRLTKTQKWVSKIFYLVGPPIDLRLSLLFPLLKLRRIRSLGRRPISAAGGELLPEDRLVCNRICLGSYRHRFDRRLGQPLQGRCRLRQIIQDLRTDDSVQQLDGELQLAGPVLPELGDGLVVAGLRLHIAAAVLGQKMENSLGLVMTFQEIERNAFVELCLFEVRVIGPYLVKNLVRGA